MSLVCIIDAALVLSQFGDEIGKNRRFGPKLGCCFRKIKLFEVKSRIPSPKDHSVSQRSELISDAIDHKYSK
jgi:hypothetical protein